MKSKLKDMFYFRPKTKRTIGVTDRFIANVYPVCVKTGENEWSSETGLEGVDQKLIFNISPEMRETNGFKNDFYNDNKELLDSQGKYHEYICGASPPKSPKHIGEIFMGAYFSSNNSEITNAKEILEKLKESSWDNYSDISTTDASEKGTSIKIEWWSWSQYICSKISEGDDSEGSIYTTEWNSSDSYWKTNLAYTGIKWYPSTSAETYTPWIDGIRLNSALFIAVGTQSYPLTIGTTNKLVLDYL